MQRRFQLPISLRGSSSRIIAPITSSSSSFTQNLISQQQQQINSLLLLTPSRHVSDAQKEIFTSVVRDDTQLNDIEHQKVVAHWTKRADEFDPITVLLLALSVVNVVGMYLIIFDWIYQGHVDLYDGTYGIDDDDDDDDDDDLLI